MATAKKTAEHDHTKGAPASVAGRAVQESSPELRQKVMGVTGTQETTLAALGGAAPVVDHAEAAKDEAERQAADDARRQAVREAEAEALENVVKDAERRNEGIAE